MNIPDYTDPVPFPNDINYARGRQEVVNAFNKGYEVLEELLAENEELIQIGEDEIYQSVFEENNLDYNNGYLKPIPDNIYDDVLFKIQNELQRDGVYSDEVMDVIEDVIYKYNCQNKRSDK